MKMLHWKSVVSLVVLACFLAAGKCQSGVACPSLVGKPGCVCNHPDGKGIIDLTSIANEASAGPRFSGLEDIYGYSYSYNPCTSYGESFCGNVHACQTSSFNPDITYSIASAGTEQIFIDPNGTPYIFYTGPGGRTVYVYLHCTGQGDPILTTKGDGEVFFEYIFDLYSVHACPGGKAPAGSIVGGIGVAFIVLFLVGIVAYFVVGMVVMRVKYKASGVDLIPHKAFWKTFPGLIKDGTMLAITPCRRLASTSEGYSEMKS